MTSPVPPPRNPGPRSRRRLDVRLRRGPGVPIQEPRKATWPGMGSRGSRCGQVVVVRGEQVVLRCKQRGCPSCSGVCWPGECAVAHPAPHRGKLWAHKVALRTRERLYGWTREHGLYGLFHVVVSPEPGTYVEGEDHGLVISGLRRAATGLAKRFRRREAGGVSVVHLWTCRGPRTWRPHVHLVGDAVVVGKEQAEEWTEAGWLVRVVTSGDGNTFRVYTGEPLLRLLTYLLDHSCAVRGQPAVLPYGSARGVRVPQYRRKARATVLVASPPPMSVAATEVA